MVVRGRVGVYILRKCFWVGADLGDGGVWSFEKIAVIGGKFSVVFSWLFGDGWVGIH